MALFDFLFKTSKRPNIAVPLDPLLGTALQEAESWACEEPEPALARARFGDLCRFIELRPPSAEGWQAAIAGLDPEGLRRLHLLVELLREPNLMRALPSLLGSGDASQLLQRGLVAPLEATGPVTLQLLLDSPLRVEELVRHLLACLQADVEGEGLPESQARLERLDYRNLLKQAEAAKASAEDRLAYLQKLQEDLEARRMPRGKW